MLDAWLDGSFVPMPEARISAFDAGFQHGMGLFETMLGRHGRVFRGLEHMERLRRSALELGLCDRLRPEALVDACEAAMARNGLEHARVRLTVTGGDMNLLVRKAEDVRHDPTVLVQVQPPTAYPPGLFEQGIGVRIADAQLNVADPFTGHKTVWYWPRLAALQRASASGMHEALWFDVTRALACGCVSNVFVVKDGVLRTPVARGEEPRGDAVRSPVLPGVTRAAVITLAGEAGMAVERCRLDVDALLAAVEVFLTNSSWQLLPVVRVEQHAVGAGVPGDAARTLRAALLEQIDRETGAAGTV